MTNLNSSERKRPLLDFQDGTLFGNDAGEDELPDILNSYFVDQIAFNPFLSRTNSFRIARSRKGMGKSALLSKLAYDLSEENSDQLVIKVTGANLIGILPPPKSASYLELQNYWQRVICSRINYALGTKIGFAFSDNAMAMVESSELAGFKERNIISALISRVKSSKIPLEIISKETSNHEELLKRSFAKIEDKDVWLLIDDIDSTYIDTPEQQALTSTFFSACRAIVRDIRGIKIRASVRSDVWSSLRANEDLDKCEQYVTDLSWSANDMKVILSKKVFSWLKRSDFGSRYVNRLDYRKDADSILEYAFVRRLRWGASMVPPFRPVYILSAGRPRWMSQICRLAGVQAAKVQKSMIGTTEINAVMKTYSGLRLADIYKEHLHQYPDLKKLIETFSNSPARYTTDDLLSQLVIKYINKVGGGNIPSLDGYPYRVPLQLAHFLFKIGFIVARKDHEGDSGNADFVRYEERPELLEDGRNPDDGLLWEIHPAYRDALSIGKGGKAARGAAAKGARKNRLR